MGPWRRGSLPSLTVLISQNYSARVYYKAKKHEKASDSYSSLDSIHPHQNPPVIRFIQFSKFFLFSILRNKSIVSIRTEESDVTLNARLLSKNFRWLGRHLPIVFRMRGTGVCKGVSFNLVRERRCVRLMGMRL